MQEGGVRPGTSRSHSMIPAGADFCLDIARRFGVEKPTQIRWAHAVNTRSKLEATLADATVHMIEADIAKGFLDEDSEPSDSICNVCCAGRPAVGARQTLIMCHPPQQRTSNLELRTFLQRVIDHNRSCLGAGSPPGSPSARSWASLDDEPEPEAPDHFGFDNVPETVDYLGKRVARDTRAVSNKLILNITNILNLAGPTVKGVRPPHHATSA